MIDRVRVQSSAIAEIGYNHITMILEVAFHAGAIYQYADVPAELYYALLSTESVGRLFDEKIRSGPFTCHRMA